MIKLYARALDSGIFVFWDDDNECNEYELSLYLINKEQKIKLCNVKVESGFHYYSFVNIAPGDYEIVISVIGKNETLQAEKKQFRVISSIEKMMELGAMIDEINMTETRIRDELKVLKDILIEPSDYIDAHSHALAKCEINNEIRTL